MKKGIIIFLFLFSKFCLSQNFEFPSDSLNNKIIYWRTYHVNNPEILQVIKKWVSKETNKNISVISVNDNKIIYHNAILITKLSNEQVTTVGEIKYKVEITIDTAKLCISVDNFRFVRNIRNDTITLESMLTEKNQEIAKEYTDIYAQINDNIISLLRYFESYHGLIISKNEYSLMANPYDSINEINEIKQRPKLFLYQFPGGIIGGGLGLITFGFAGYSLGNFLSSDTKPSILSIFYAVIAATIGINIGTPLGICLSVHNKIPEYLQGNFAGSMIGTIIGFAIGTKLYSPFNKLTIPLILTTSSLGGIMGYNISKRVKQHNYNKNNGNLSIYCSPNTVMLCYKF